MRIQNNITAMNTHRQYTINNDNVAKAAEKLSSGYRINRAGDDAAGLAISEKMRSQIRGLNMATKNSQDAISLVQTAEGALQETHSMLQRMNELAVQAATGTNQEFDRIQAAKEFDQLKREINDVAEQTTFNNMKVLDGSLSYGGYVRSAATAGVTATTENVAGVKVGDNPVSMEGTDFVAGAPAKENVTATAATVQVSNVDGKLGSTSAASNANTTYTLDFGELGTLTFKGVAGKGIGQVAFEELNKIAGGTTVATGTVATGALASGDWEAKGIATAGTYADSDKGFNIVSKNPGASNLGPITPTLTAVPDPTTLTTGTPTTTADSRTQFTLADATNGSLGGANNTGATPPKGVTTAGAKYQIEISWGGTDKVVLESDAAPADGKSIGQLFNGKEVEIDGHTYVANWDNANNGTLTFVSKDANPAGDLLNGKTITAKVSAVGTPPAQDLAPAKVTQGVDGQTAAPATGDTNKFSVDWANMKDGSTLTVNGNKYTYGVDFKDDASLVQAITDKDDKITASVDGTKIKLEQKQGAPDPDTNAATFTGDVKNVKWEGPTGEGTKTTVEIDFAKLADGDRIKVNIGGVKGDDGTITGGTDIFVEKKEGQTRDDVMNAVKKKITDTFGADQDRVKVNGSALIVTGTTAHIQSELDIDGLEGKDTNAMRIQVGALENEQLNIAIDSMNTAGLGLDAMNLETQDSAGTAITAVRNAVNKVSEQRATLGAMQNRLDHKIANLKVSSENLSAAESRIRDVDMASEMTNFTKNNILSQAATAMLAQANALPQNVLSLLG